MLEAVTPVAVAPVALPGPQTWPSVPKLLEPADCACPDRVLEAADEEDDDDGPQPARASMARTQTTALILVLVREPQSCMAPPELPVMQTTLTNG
jgi:hypothetical protein